MNATPGGFLLEDVATIMQTERCVVLCPCISKCLYRYTRVNRTFHDCFRSFEYDSFSSKVCDFDMTYLLMKRGRLGITVIALSYQ